MSQPKIQQFQTDIAGGSGGEVLDAHVSVYRSSTLSIPSGTLTTLTFTDQNYEEGGNWWTAGTDTFTVPSGITRLRAQGHVHFKPSSGSIPFSTVMLFMITDPTGLTPCLGSFSVHGSGVTSDYTDVLNILSPWISVTPGQTLQMKVYHTHGSNLNLTEAWITIEGMIT